MKKAIGLFVFLVCLGMQICFAQTRQITGTVIDKNDKSPLPGVSVMVKGTNSGTATDVDGKFTLKVNEGDVLIVSFIGMKTQEVVVKNQPNLVIELSGDSKALDEVIVVGYGTQTREAATGAVGTVSASDLKDIPVESVDKALYGKVAGVQINSGTGQPGSQTQIRIRGFSSVNAGMEPLYVIDGVPVNSGKLDDALVSTNNILASLNPRDIESLTILKDAAAAAIYGSRAANGVILITTKSGKQGKTKVNFNANWGVSKLSNDNNYHPMSAQDLYKYMRAALVNTGYDPITYKGLTGTPAGFFASEELPANVETYNWEDAAFKNAPTQEYQLSFSGGNDKTRFFLSGNYLNQEGIIPSTSYKRMSFRANIDNQCNTWLSVGAKLNGTRSIQQDMANESMYYSNPVWAAQNILPWHLPYTENGDFNFNIPSNANTNFLATAKYDDQWEKTWKLNGNFYVQIEPLKGLVFKTLNAIEFTNAKGRRYWSPKSSAPDQEDGTLQATNTEIVMYNTSNTLSYTKVFHDDHNFRALVGLEAEEYEYTQDYGSSTGLGYVIPWFSNSTKEKSELDYKWTRYTMLSYFGILEYDYRSKYYFKGSIRRDGSSKFGKDNRWGTFWSVGLSWNIHNEEFMQSVDWVQLLKFRGSYGVSGNDAIGNYQQYGLYGTANNNGLVGMNPSNLANSELGWENNSSYNIGIDFALLNWLDGSIEYYNRKTTDMLMNVPLSQTTGFNFLRKNVGKMSNKGVELNLSAKVINREIKWNLFGNIAYNKVKLLDLGGVTEMSSGGFSKHRLGGGFSDFYVYDYAGVNPSNGLAMWYDKNNNITPEYAKARQVFRGQQEPDFVGGFGTEVYWKGISLSANFEYKVGHYVFLGEGRYTRSDGFNWGNNQANVSNNYWKQPGDITDTPKPLVNNSTGSNEWGTSRFLYKGDYLRFKTLMLAYSLPKSWLERISLEQVRVYFSGNNLYCWNDVPYYDPEREVSGTPYIPYPQTKTFSFGVEIGF